jgi:Na+/melibiose symporter-like transporter
VTLPAIPQGIAGAVFLTMMRESVSGERLTALTSRRQVGLNAGIAVGALGFGILLESLPFPLNYQLMFLVAFTFALMSQWHVFRIKILYPTAERPAQPEPQPRPRPMRLKRGDGIALLKVRSFRTVLMCVFVLHLAFFSTVAIVPLHLVQNLNASESFIALFGIVELISGMLIATQTDKLARWIGQRGLMSAGMFGTALAAVAIALAPRPELTLIAAAISGASWTASVVGLFSFFYENTPTCVIGPVWSSDEP